MQFSFPHSMCLPKMSDVVFLLFPLNGLASAVVEDGSNSTRRYLDPVRPKEPCLRIGLRDKIKDKSVLVSFGRRKHNDVKLPPPFFPDRTVLLRFQQREWRPSSPRRICKVRHAAPRDPLSPDQTRRGAGRGGRGGEEEAEGAGPSSDIRNPSAMRCGSRSF